MIYFCVSVLKVNWIPDRSVQIFFSSLDHYGAFAFFAGNLCPMGYYCESGVSNGTGCPEGTFLNTTGGREEADCLDCTAGYYCAGYGNVDPSGPCTSGYYCPPSQIVSTPPATFCPIGK